MGRDRLDLDHGGVAMSDVRHVAPASGFTLEIPCAGHLTVEHEILEALGRIEKALAMPLRPTSPAPDLLDRREVAAWLGVSTRWVERHLRPTSQPRAGGRAWYTRADVEDQMRALRPHGAAPPLPRRRSKLVPRATLDTDVQKRIAAIEARLRDEPAETGDEAPISTRKRGARVASRR